MRFHLVILPLTLGAVAGEGEEFPHFVRGETPCTVRIALAFSEVIHRSDAEGLRMVEAEVVPEVRVAIIHNRIESGRQATSDSGLSTKYVVGGAARDRVVVAREADVSLHIGGEF